MGRGEQMNYAQIAHVLDWLEVESNFKLITGGNDQQEVVAGSKLKKTDAYKDLGDYVNEKMGYMRPPELWDKHKTKGKYESCLRKYKKAKNMLLDTTGAKFCVTPTEALNKVTIEMKLNKVIISIYAIYYAVKTIF